MGLGLPWGLPLPLGPRLPFGFSVSDLTSVAWDLLTKVITALGQDKEATAKFHHAGFGLALPSAALPEGLYGSIPWGLGTHHNLSMLIYLMRPDDFRLKRLTDEVNTINAEGISHNEGLEPFMHMLPGLLSTTAKPAAMTTPAAVSMEN